MNWRIGNYVFQVNPNEYSGDIQVVGDTMTTLNGRVIAQPSAIREKYSLKTILYSRTTHATSTISLSSGVGSTAVSYSMNNKILVGTYSGSIYICNINALGESFFNVPTTYKNIVDLTSDSLSQYTYYLVNPSQNLSYVYQIPYSGGSVVNSWQTPPDNFAGIAIDNTGVLWCMTRTGTVYKLVNGVFTFQWSLGSQLVGAMSYVSCDFDGQFLWITEVGAFNKTYQVTTGGTVVNAFDNLSPNVLGCTHLPNRGVLFLNNNGTVTFGSANLVMADAYIIETIVRGGTFTITDDFGAQKKVALSSAIDKRRLPGFYNALELSMTVDVIST